jgi:hypothetical protein
MMLDLLIKELLFFLTNFDQLLVLSHVVVNAVNLARAEPGTTLQFLQRQVLGLRSKQRQTARQGSMMLEQLKGVEVIEFGVSDLVHLNPLFVLTLVC